MDIIIWYTPATHGPHKCTQICYRSCFDYANQQISVDVWGPVVRGPYIQFFVSRKTYVACMSSWWESPFGHRNKCTCLMAQDRSILNIIPQNIRNPQSVAVLVFSRKEWITTIKRNSCIYVWHLTLLVVYTYISTKLFNDVFYIRVGSCYLFQFHIIYIYYAMGDSGIPNIFTRSSNIYSFMYMCMYTWSKSSILTFTLEMLYPIENDIYVSARSKQSRGNYLPPCSTYFVGSVWNRPAGPNPIWLMCHGRMDSTLATVLGGELCLRDAGYPDSEMRTIAWNKSLKSITKPFVCARGHAFVSPLHKINYIRI